MAFRMAQVFGDKDQGELFWGCGEASEALQKQSKDLVTEMWKHWEWKKMQTDSKIGFENGGIIGTEKY